MDQASALGSGWQPSTRWRSDPQRRARLGAGTHISSKVVVHEGCIVGPNCHIDPGAIIGGSAFSFEWYSGRWYQLPTLGIVELGPNVYVGANTTIDRGIVGDTRIKDGVKLDNQVQIGHDVEIGEHSIIAGCVGIAGYAQIGSRCVIAGQVGVAERCKIADYVQITARTLVSGNLDNPGGYSGHLPFAKTSAVGEE